MPTARGARTAENAALRANGFVLRECYRRSIGCIGLTILQFTPWSSSHAGPVRGACEGTTGVRSNDHLARGTIQSGLCVSLRNCVLQALWNGVVRTAVYLPPTDRMRATGSASQVRRLDAFRPRAAGAEVRLHEREKSRIDRNVGADLAQSVADRSERCSPANGTRCVREEEGGARVHLYFASSSLPICWRCTSSGPSAKRSRRAVA